MRAFKRNIRGRNIFVQIDDDFFNSQEHLFLSLLSTFHQTEEVSSSSFIVRPIISDDESYYCNLNDESWVFHLSNRLEDYFAEILDCTILHGSLISVLGKNISIIGERMSGKTTLTKHLIDKRNAKYLTDDCIYILDEKYFGFCMPIPMRNAAHRNDNVLCRTYDNENIQRTLFIVSSTVDELDKMHHIIFPKYDKNVSNISVRQVERSHLFNRITTNVRHMSSIREMYRDLNNVIKNISAYEISYSNCDDVYKWLKVISKNRA